MPPAPDHADLYLRNAAAGLLVVHVGEVTASIFLKSFHMLVPRANTLHQLSHFSLQQFKDKAYYHP